MNRKTHLGRGGNLENRTYRYVQSTETEKPKNRYWETAKPISETANPIGKPKKRPRKPQKPLLPGNRKTEKTEKTIFGNCCKPENRGNRCGKPENRKTFPRKPKTVWETENRYGPKHIFRFHGIYQLIPPITNFKGVMNIC